MEFPRHIKGLISNRGEVMAGLAGFLLTIALLDSGGLAQWARRLEIGPLRRVAVPVTAAINQTLRPLGIDPLRHVLLADLARLHWTRDRAAQQAASQPRPQLVPPTVSPRPMAPPKPNAAMIIATASDKPTKPIARVANPNPAPPAVPILTKLPLHTRLPALAPLPPGVHRRTIALVGDSMMAVGLSDMVLRQTANDPALRVIRAFRSGTGLARPDVFNWMTEYPAMIGKNHPNLIIVAIGANDAQGYVDRKGKVLAYGTPAWIASYRARVRRFLTLLQASSQQVLWIGMPPMQQPGYAARMRALNRITATVVAADPHAVWWNPALFIGTKSGQFRALGPASRDQGAPIVHLRQPDGIHLTDDGAGLLTAQIIPWLAPLPLPPPREPPIPIEQPSQRGTQGSSIRISGNGVPSAQNPK
jgi:lysophospholipase L1-like esterase